METLTINSLGEETSYEIERDMRIYFRVPNSGKVSVQEFVESIADQCPLLGMADIAEADRKAVEVMALKAMGLSLSHTKVAKWACLAIFLTVIQYAKNWDRAESKGFWPYISEQFGYQYSQPLYEVLTSSVKEACKSYNRLFVVDSHGDNGYYSTVFAHSLAPAKSFFVSVKGTAAFRILNRSEKMDSKDILADLRGLKST